MTRRDAMGGEMPDMRLRGGCLRIAVFGIFAGDLSLYQLINADFGQCVSKDWKNAGSCRNFQAGNGIFDTFRPG